MASWITEKDFYQADAKGLGIYLNTAFILEIKEDHQEFRERFSRLESLFQNPEFAEGKDWISELANQLSLFRDQLETYFALEEFYGGFGISPGSHSDSELIQNGDLARLVARLKQQHVDLFLNLNQVVELVEQLVYDETPSSQFGQVRDRFDEFCSQFRAHESFEMEVVMRLCNEELGTGD